MDAISSIWNRIQRSLFPFLEEELGQLTEYYMKLAAILEVVRIEDFFRNEYWFGRPSADRKALGRAFIAKAVYNEPTTCAFLDRLRNDAVLRRMCGWERKGQIPSESTFSRAFAECAKSRILERVHEALIKRTLPDHLFGHISQDSTEIETREKPAVKKEREPKQKKKRGRPARGEKPAFEPTCIERQMTMTVEEMLAELPTVCDRGTARGT